VRLILWFLLKRFVPRLNIDIIDPREYVKERLISHVLSFIRPSNWLFLTLIFLFGAVFCVEILYFVGEMIYNMFVIISSHMNSTYATMHTVNLTSEAAFLWFFSLVFTFLSIFIHLLGIVQHAVQPFVRFRRFDFPSISWLLFAVSIVLHIGAYVIP
jgi:hypothetical protein